MASAAKELGGCAAIADKNSLSKGQVRKPAPKMEFPEVGRKNCQERRKNEMADK